MNYKSSLNKTVVTIFAFGIIHSVAFADDDTPSTNSWTPGNSRFGPFGCLDHRSSYYQDIFPEPLLLEDTGVEPEGELELNYLHETANQQQSDVVTSEFQGSLGVATFEFEVPFERFSDSDDTAQGVGNIELSARCPFYQYVSPNGMFGTTTGAGLEVGVPVNSQVSKNTELEPGIFEDLSFGNHFTIQTTLGYDELFGGGDDGGSEEFEYGLDFAYSIPRSELPIPAVARISPMFEVDGELGLNQDETGQNSVLGSAGFRLDFRPVDDLEPSFGLGYVFPMSSVAREEVHWGIAASFTVEL